MAVVERPERTLPRQELPRTAPPHRKRLRNRLAWPIALAVLVTLGVLFTRRLATTVRVIRPRTVPVTETLAGAGIIEGQAETILSSDVQGTIVELLVDENSRVRRGQLLALVRNRTAEGALLQAKAVLERTKTQLEQTEAGPSVDEIASARARVDGARDGVTRATSVLSGAQLGPSLTSAEVPLRDTDLPTCSTPPTVA